jgi:hypothetical protein
MVDRTAEKETPAAVADTVPLAIVSGADAGFFDLLKGLIGSILDKPQGRAVRLCIFDLGLTEPQRLWLSLRGAILRIPASDHGADVSPIIDGLLARAKIPDYFPGAEIYLWLDADLWIQDWAAIEAYVDGAARLGFSIAAEVDRAYSMPMVLHTHGRFFAQYGFEDPRPLLAKSPLNAGAFAGRAGATHWQAWWREANQAFERPHDAAVDFYLDQAALNVVIHRDGLPPAILPATHNWACHWALPAVSDDGMTLHEPLYPHALLKIVHLAAHTKHGIFQLATVGNGRSSRSLRYEARSQLVAGDYVSPGLALARPDECFPNMILGDPSTNSWPWLRRGIPHRWYNDRRYPGTGFANRDEASILYNTALRFQGRNALEIGCFLGWSAVHLAMGGVNLDIVDPFLSDPSVGGSVRDSLVGAKPAGRVRLFGGLSPAIVEHLAAEGTRWTLFFIDGDHEGMGPTNDAIVAERYATKDALMLFHDLAAPAVCAAVAWLKNRGWNVRVYHTAQIMAAAWRGNVEPIDHQPDPTVDWAIPAHVRALMG